MRSGGCFQFFFGVSCMYIYIYFLLLSLSARWLDEPVWFVVVFSAVSIVISQSYCLTYWKSRLHERTVDQLIMKVVVARVFYKANISVACGSIGMYYYLPFGDKNTYSLGNAYCCLEKIPRLYGQLHASIVSSNTIPHQNYCKLQLLVLIGELTLQPLVKE